METFLSPGHPMLRCLKAFNALTRRYPPDMPLVSKTELLQTFVRISQQFGARVLNAPISYRDESGIMFELQLARFADDNNLYGAVITCEVVPAEAAYEIRCDQTMEGLSPAWERLLAEYLSPAANQFHQQLLRRAVPVDEPPLDLKPDVGPQVRQNLSRLQPPQG